MMHDAEVAISEPVPVGHPLLRRARWAKRLHAWLLARGNASYERAIAARKRALFGALRGTVVELGAGPGANLRYFARDIRAAGFSAIEIDHWDAPLPAIVRPHISGVAVR